MREYAAELIDLFQSNSISIFLSIFAGLVITPIPPAVRAIRDTIGGTFSGKWYNCIFDSSGGIVSIDTVIAKQRGQMVYGKIRRIFSSTANEEEFRRRKWKFTGRVTDNEFFAIFWSVDPLIISRGSWYVVSKRDYHYEGSYLKPSPDKGFNVLPVTLHFTKSYTEYTGGRRMRND